MTLYRINKTLDEVLFGIEPTTDKIVRAVKKLITCRSMRTDIRIVLKFNKLAVRYKEDLDKAEREAETFRKDPLLHSFAKDIYYDVAQAAKARLAIGIWDIYHSTEWGY